jgi:hypothetical protein
LPTENHFNDIAACVSSSFEEGPKIISEFLDNVDLSLNLPIDVITNRMTSTEKPSALRPDVVADDCCDVILRLIKGGLVGGGHLADS